VGCRPITNYNRPGSSKLTDPSASGSGTCPAGEYTYKNYRLIFQSEAGPWPGKGVSPGSAEVLLQQGGGGGRGVSQGKSAPLIVTGVLHPLNFIISKYLTVFATRTDPIFSPSNCHFQFRVQPWQGKFTVFEPASLFILWIPVKIYFSYQIKGWKIYFERWWNNLASSIWILSR
jgi:hypothetical protein